MLQRHQLISVGRSALALGVGGFLICGLAVGPARSQSDPRAQQWQQMRNQYETRLNDEWKKCDRGAYNHDLQNLAALAQIIQQAETEERLTRDRQTGQPSGGHGLTYMDSVYTNQHLADFRARSWNHCLPPKQTSMTTSPSPGRGATAAFSESADRESRTMAFASAGDRSNARGTYSLTGGEKTTFGTASFHDTSSQGTFETTRGGIAAGPRSIEAGEEPCHVREFAEHGVKEVEAVGPCLHEGQECELQVRKLRSMAAWSTASTPHTVPSPLNEEYRPFCR